MTQITIHQFRQKRRERSHHTDHREQHAEERLKSVVAIIFSTITLISMELLKENSQVLEMK